ncbi:MAG: hypothetical protein P9X24_16150 [Candidatus Hatepunaea meridiana]|nr:hypothetical protein [Candidatus Hatepunaea meridiana]
MGNSEKRIPVSEKPGYETQDLVNMVKSDDPEYRGIFERCYWRRTPDEEAKENQKKEKH